MNYFSVLHILLFQVILYILHEIGHIVTAKTLKLKIFNIGFLLKPYPHIYVAIKWPKNHLQKYVYLFSGTFTTLCLFIVALYFNFFDNKYLYWAFMIQFIIELNPFYSDFTIAFVTSKESSKNRMKSYANNYNTQFKKYQFSLNWYIHFTLWTLIIYVFIKFNKYIL
jgi:hypothetical protein